MSISYPSRILTIVDLPEPQDVKGEFVYAYFTPDEQMSPGNTIISGLVDPNLLSTIRNNSPRYVQIKFSPVILKNCIESQTNSLSIDTILDPEFKLSNIGKIKSEDEFSNFDYISLNFQDENIDEKLFNMISGSAVMRGINPTTLTDLNDSITYLFQDLSEAEYIREATFGYQSCGIFYRPPEREIAELSLLNKLKNFKVHMQINNKVSKTIVDSIIEDSFNLYSEEANQILPQIVQLQNYARSNNAANAIKTSDWDIGFDPIKILPMPSSQFDVIADVKIVGYIIEKYVIDNSTQERFENVFLIKGNTSTTFLDDSIVYGKTYSYKIKSVAGVRLPGFDQDGNPVVVYGFVSSKTSKREVVKAIDTTPPAHPADFKPTWDFEKNKLRLMWSFPVNPSRDIKKFQIFRRKSIKDPFVLLKEYNFDDSYVVHPRPERIPTYLIENMIGNPKTYFYDEEFTKDSKFIYALCSIDAHGLSSNLSIQFETSFDRFKNQIVLKAVSLAGAPKSYPNMFLQIDSFQDAIKVSGYESIKVYFNPDALRIFSSENNDLDFIPISDPNGNLKMSIINVDRQKGKTLKININDLTQV